MTDETTTGEITFAGTLTRDDVAAALRLHADPRVRRLAVVFFVVLSIATLWFVAATADWLVGAVFALFVLAFLFVFFGPSISARQQWKDNQLLRSEMSGTADETGVRLAWPGASAEVEWRAVYAYKMDREMVLIYLAKQQFNTVLRRFFAEEEDWQRFRDLVRARAEPYRAETSNRTLRSLAMWTMIFVAVVLLWQFFVTSR